MSNVRKRSIVFAVDTSDYWLVSLLFANAEARQLKTAHALSLAFLTEFSELTVCAIVQCTGSGLGCRQCLDSGRLLGVATRATLPSAASAGEQRSVFGRCVRPCNGSDARCGRQGTALRYVNCAWVDDHGSLHTAWRVTCSSTKLSVR